MITYSPLSQSYHFDRGYCHKKVNQIGQLSRLNLTSVLEQKQSITLALPKIHNRQPKTPPKKSQAHQRRHSQITYKPQDNPEFDPLENLTIHKSIFLSKKIHQMKQRGLMDKNRLRVMRYDNQNTRSVMNDFHSPKTNGGFSRSKTGSIYYK